MTLACLLLAGCSKATLYSDLEERQANEVFAALLGAGIGADKRTSLSKTGWEIRVSQGEFAQAMQVLQARGLPRQKYASMCEVFKKEGIASSAIEEKARYRCSIQEELARTFSSYPGVVEARVHVAMPDPDPLGGSTGEASAAVVIFQQPGSNLESWQTRIKTVVKDSSEGLIDINRVSVEFVPMPGFAPVAQGQRQGGSPVAMSFANAWTIGIGLAVLAVLGLAGAVWNRLRQARGRQQPVAEGGGLWKG